MQTNTQNQRIKKKEGRERRRKRRKKGGKKGGREEGMKTGRKETRRGKAFTMEDVKVLSPIQPAQTPDADKAASLRLTV